MQIFEHLPNNRSHDFCWSSADFRRIQIVAWKIWIVLSNCNSTLNLIYKNQITSQIFYLRSETWACEIASVQNLTETCDRGVEWRGWNRPWPHCDTKYLLSPSWNLRNGCGVQARRSTWSCSQDIRWTIDRDSSFFSTWSAEEGTRLDVEFSTLNIALRMWCVWYFEPALEFFCS